MQMDKAAVAVETSLLATLHFTNTWTTFYVVLPMVL